MRGAARVGAVAAIVLTGTLSFAAAAQAKTFEVTRTGDPVPGACQPRDCSLREAVQAANSRAGADKVVLPNRRKPYLLTIPGDTADDARDGDLDVANGSLAIVHPGKGRAEIRGVELDDRLFDTFEGAPLRLSRVSLTGGAVLPFNGNGGAIRAAARVTVKGSTIVGNTADEAGGAIDTNAALVISDSVLARNESTISQGGALNVREEAPIRITSSVIRRNSASSTGGAIRNAGGPVTVIGSRFIRNEAGAQGGALRNAGDGDILIVRSRFTGNVSGAYGGALELNASETVIRQTTIDDNRAADEGGGIALDGTTLDAVNSTIAGNRSLSFGGGIFSEGTSAVALNAVTVARNVADADQMGLAMVAGGGMYRADAASFTVRNSLIALNGQGPEPFRQDCAGDPFDSLGNNLLTERDSCDGFDAPGDIERANPKLGPLRDNGGPTRTVALKKGSPAIGKAHKPSAPNRDQRGVKRDSRPDIGAYER